MSERVTVGFDRGVELDWLDLVASRLADGKAPPEARAALWALLDGKVAGDNPQSARGKTVTVVSRIWIKPPTEVSALRADALACFADCDAGGRLALHWAMMIAAYPFFADVAEMVGKIGRLNDEVAAGQIVRRMKQAWGDRTTLPPAIQRLVRSMGKWDVLKELPQRGSYRIGSQVTVTDRRLASILVRSLLIRTGHGMRLPDLIRNPALFPFELAGDAANARSWPHTSVSRQGDQTEFVEAA